MEQIGIRRIPHSAEGNLGHGPHHAFGDRLFKACFVFGGVPCHGL
jgi:hypothetical protein